MRYNSSYSWLFSSVTLFLFQSPGKFSAQLFSLQLIFVLSSFIKSWVTNGKVAKLRTEAAANHLSFDQQCRLCEKVSTLLLDYHFKIWHLKLKLHNPIEFVAGIHKQLAIELANISMDKRQGEERVAFRSWRIL